MRRAMRRAMRRDETFHVWTTGSRTGSRTATEVYRPPDCPSIVDRTKLHFLSSGLSAFLLIEVRRGGRDVSTDDRVERDGVRERASRHTGYHEQSGQDAEKSGEVRAGG